MQFLPGTKTSRISTLDNNSTPAVGIDLIRALKANNGPGHSYVDEKNKQIVHQFVDVLYKSYYSRNHRKIK